jgi:hypothetical protein
MSLSTDVPFDPSPRPGEVEQVLARVRRRRAVLAGGSGATVLAGVAAVAVLLGGSGTQVLVQDDDPVGPASSAPSSAPLPPPPVLSSAQPSSGPVALPSRIPVIGPSPTAAPTPRPDDQATAAPPPRPASERPAYADQLDPTYIAGEATDCIVQRNTGEGVIRNEYCVYFTALGSKDVYVPRVRMCRTYDSSSAGTFTFPTGEEVDFVLSRGEERDGRPVATTTLLRFSDTVRYDGQQRTRTADPGGCWSWSLRIPVDFEAYPAEAGFVFEWVNRAEQFDEEHERYQSSYFTAGDFHGDDTV